MGDLDLAVILHDAERMAYSLRSEPPTLIDRRMADMTVPALVAEVERLRVELAEAERRGYEQAITHLRDTAGYDAWCDDPLRSLFRSRADDWFRDHFADYLSARLTEETG